MLVCPGQASRTILAQNPSMALIRCPECGAQVSDKAASCPQCGHPIHVHKNTKLMQTLHVGWLGIAIIALIVALFAMIGTCNWKPV